MVAPGGLFILRRVADPNSISTILGALMILCNNFRSTSAQPKFTIINSYR